MRFDDLPRWLGRFALEADEFYPGLVLLIVSALHIAGLVLICRNKRLGKKEKAVMCMALLDLPVITVFIFYLAGLPQA